jgi:hypothetical protein
LGTSKLYPAIFENVKTGNPFLCKFVNKLRIFIFLGKKQGQISNRLFLKEQYLENQSLPNLKAYKKGK